MYEELQIIHFSMWFWICLVPSWNRPHNLTDILPIRNTHTTFLQLTNSTYFIVNLQCNSLWQLP